MSIEPAKPASELNTPTTRPTPCAVSAIPISAHCTVSTTAPQASVQQRLFAVKIVGGGKYFDHATPYYSKLRILKLVDPLKLEKALFVFKYRSNALPSAFKKYFSEVCNDRSTRSVIQTNYFIPFTKSTMLQRSIKYQSPVVWNSLILI